jgi:hypothetical protein
MEYIDKCATITYNRNMEKKYYEQLQSVRVPGGTKKCLKRVAFKLKLNNSEVIRNAVLKYLKEVLEDENK